MDHELCYISANSNALPSILDWGRNGLICYGSCNSILIYDTNVKPGGKVIQSLVGHQDRVNCVKWLKGVESENELISVSADNTARVWYLYDNFHKTRCSILEGHSEPVLLADGLYNTRNCYESCLVATASMDSTIKIWVRIKRGEDFNLLQTITYSYSIVVGLTISYTPDTDGFILACSNDSSDIELYIKDKNRELFELGTKLKGHEDWVRGLAFTICNNGDMLLASSSQDMYIRLWRFSLQNSSSSSNPENKEILTINDVNYGIKLDSILTGHEGWIYSVNWSGNGQLLSSSLDKTIIIWELDPDSDLWLEKVRLGEIGGNSLGFYGAYFSPDANRIIGHSYQGALHIWHKTENTIWTPQVTIGGHFGQVTDMVWCQNNGEYLLTVSTDQTTRIHAPWNLQNGNNSKNTTTWHEIARPQVHGYDMASIACLSQFKFASASEEKIIRTFCPPPNFLAGLQNISKSNLPIEKRADFENMDRIKGVSVPSLGLSNKALYIDEDLMDSEEAHFTSVLLNEPPTEETLIQNTLWPEMQKLYGHGYEVYTLATSSDGQFLASSCKSTKQEHATILLWDTNNWRIIDRLVSHTLTVVQLAFSPDSQHLLSVSRDRRWSVFTKNSTNNNRFELVATTDKKTAIHNRIIWCCGWSHDSKYFGTGARDGKVVIWTKFDQSTNSSTGNYAKMDMFDFKKDSVTALSFAPILLNDLNYLLAIGFECGHIKLFKWSEQWECVLDLDQQFAHHLTVRKLCFRPIQNENIDILQLASCSSDFSVKIHNLKLLK